MKPIFEKRNFQMNTIGFIGGGNMARCLIGGLIQKGYAPEKLWVSNPHANDNMVHFQQLGVHTSLDNTVVAEQSSLLIFSVKPKILPEVAYELAGIVQTKQPCILSIAAGVRLESLQKWLGADTSIVRAMPNTPALVGYGATGLYANTQVNTEQKKLITWAMETVGMALWVDTETQLDTVTALSGSGPAYFFLVMEALAQAATELGLPASIAEQLTRQTALGAAHLASNTQEPLAQLRARVTSPGGTTEQAINVLEQGELRALFAKAITAAQRRAVELAEQANRF
jgi:pyrroline-5-carboxylate reductase